MVNLHLRKSRFKGDTDRMVIYPLRREENDSNCCLLNGISDRVANV